MGFADFLCNKVMPAFGSLEDTIQTQILKLLAEVCMFTGTLQKPLEATQAIYKLLMDAVPHQPETATDETDDFEFTKLECLLFAFHTVASQAPTFLTENPDLLKDFKTRLQYFALAIQGYIRKLDEFIKNKTKIELQKEENQVRVVAHRSAKNISTVIKDLFKIPPSYKSRIVVSWRPPNDKVALAAGDASAVKRKSFFENFGEILSCKVSTDAATGESRGYGFVQFVNAADASKAMEGLNGKFINVGDEGEKGKQIFVGPFISRNQRSGVGNRFTNVYLKHLNPNLTMEKFNELVIKATEDIATVTSPWLSTNTRTREDGTEVEESKGFGFVNFESHEGALRALERFRDMNKMREVVPELLHPKEDLYAAEAKNKNRNQLGKVPHNRNLYIKNIAETVTDKQLEELFAQFGEIVSTKIMVNEDTGVKRGFGFVCFKNPDDARKAITQMNNFHLEGKPLYVALAQPKEAR